MLNYLSRRGDPVPYINFMSPEVLAFGESHMVAALDQAKPDFIVLVDKDTTEYGVPVFGRDYGRGLMAWVTATYRTVRVFGAPPLVDHRFGVAILELNPGVTAGSALTRGPS